MVFCFLTESPNLHEPSSSRASRTSFLYGTGLRQIVGHGRDPGAIAGRILGRTAHFVQSRLFRTAPPTARHGGNRRRGGPEGPTSLASNRDPEGSRGGIWRGRRGREPCRPGGGAAR